MGTSAARTWSITELADEHHVTLRTIRHYEALGLLHPERRGSTRVFHNRDRIRLELVLRGRRLGFSLEEIARIVNMYDDQPGEAGQLEYLLAQIDVRRTELARMRADIDQIERELDEVAARSREALAALTGVRPSSPAPGALPPPAARPPRRSSRAPRG